MKKIVTILGARPQFIKAAVLSRLLSEIKTVSEVIVHTGQHFDSNMSAVFFEEMQIPKPTYNLSINNLGHGAMTGQMLLKIEEVLQIEKPNLVIVYGDTNSTLAGALAAKKLNIKVVHIEAGLRSFNMKMPEEINRILTDRISDLLCCPTATAIRNLNREGFGNFPSKIIECGDIMKDAFEYYSELAEKKSTIISDLKLTENNFVLATVHRQENTNDISKLKTIFEGLEKINSITKVIVPLHPRTQAILKNNNLKFNCTIVEPVGYFDMLKLLKKCKMVVTDSGGLQKEAFFSKKPCIIIREETEWIELVENNFAELVGSNSDKIVQSFLKYKNESIDYNMQIFGNKVGKKIITELSLLL